MGNCFTNISVNEQVQLFTQIIQKIISNHSLPCDVRNPSWIEEKIKHLVPHKNHTYNAYFRDSNADLFNKFRSQTRLKTVIKKCEQIFLSLYDNSLDSKGRSKLY